ncbi:MAG: cysteate synthase [Candidatus Aminicenantes bacterium]|nr:cysteate synthase [Candidatus Aminicenantes bacterium]
MNKYNLECLFCGARYEDDSFRLKCDNDHKPSLLRTVYANKKLTVHENKMGMFKFMDFLPVERIIHNEGAPVTFKSERLAELLGLKNLYIIFNGYWPEKKAMIYTASFKELEAPSVLARSPEDNTKTIVVASAGNTGRAFANICSSNKIPIVLVIPETNIEEIWSPQPFNDCVKLILASGASDYLDAITLAEKITGFEGFFPEGGAANVARRDGMATTVLDAGHHIGQIPDHYFQAVGSGTGGIAAWESALRLAEDGSYGKNGMRLHLAQNYPFTPMSEAWKNRMRNLPNWGENESKEKIKQIESRVLSNRKPPYSVVGGVYDTLSASNGLMYSVTNKEAEEAMDLFEQHEGCDLHPASGIALGALIQAGKNKQVGKDDIIVLNATGGGEGRIRRDFHLYYLPPFARLTDKEINSEEAAIKIESILKNI